MKEENLRSILLVVLAVVVVFVVVALVVFFRTDKKTLTPVVYSKPAVQYKSPPVRPAPEKPISYYPEIGDTVKLVFGESSAHLGRSENDLSDLIKYISARDEMGIFTLLAADRIFSVPNGTKARFIETAGFGVAEVRILEGKYFGYSGFVVREACRKK